MSKKRVDFKWTKVEEDAFQYLKQQLMFACGAVMSQITNGEDLPVCYISKSFNKGERNKPIIEKDCSDHKPLIYLYNLKNRKLTRVRLDLEEFDFVIEYIKGTDNVAADALSRITLSEIKET